ncbi:MAG TPA: pentapeptide repeat-containing protein [Candidatus Acidoferrales bacterium]|nr:pentapeptide repeat-containing protein [Candidatus Acidoferrales bacterium]
MALKPINFADPMYQLLRDGNVKEFNRRKAAGEQCNLTNCDLRNLDLRGFDAAGLDLSDSYLRNANLRAIDFSTARLEGASLNGAKISGFYFPVPLDPEEIALSVAHGTRLRYKK